MRRKSGLGIRCSEDGCLNEARNNEWRFCTRHYNERTTPEKINRSLSPLFRVLSKTIVTDCGCWVFLGAWAAGDYGYYNDGGKVRPAHYATYEAVFGPVPVEFELDHLCRIHPCIRPSHLEMVTHAENINRGNRWNGGLFTYDYDSIPEEIVEISAKDL